MEAGQAPPEALEYPGGPAGSDQQYQQAAGEWHSDGAAIRGLAAGQADHFAALEQQLGQQAQQQQQLGLGQQASRDVEVGEEQEEAGLPRAQKRQRRQAQQRERTTAGPAPTLAQLAAQLDGPAATQQGQAGEEQALAVAAAQAAGSGGKLQRFNLFAEEEEAAAAAKRKNPEAEVREKGGEGGGDAAQQQRKALTGALACCPCLLRLPAGQLAGLPACLPTTCTPIGDQPCNPHFMPKPLAAP